MKNKHPKCHQTSPDHAKQTLLEGSPGKTNQHKKKDPLPWEPACFVTHALLAGPKNTPLHQWLPMAHPGSHCLVVAEVGFNEDLGSCQGLEGSMKLLEGFLQWLLLPWKTNTVFIKNKNNHPSSLTGSSSQSTVFFVRLCQASHVVCVENVGWWQVFHFPNQQLAAEALSEISLVCCLILWLKTAKAKPWWAWNILAFELHTNILNIPIANTVASSGAMSTLPVQHIKSSQASIGLNRLAAKQLRQSRICGAKQMVRWNLASTVFTCCSTCCDFHGSILSPF